MDKYTIKDSVLGARFYIFKNDLEMGYLSDKKDAQEYIALKNQPRMSKLHKEIALQCLNAIRRNGIRPADYNIKYLDEAIEIISNLPTGENK